MPSVRAQQILGGCLVALGVALVFTQQLFRKGEATVAAGLLSGTHTASHAQSVGPVVIFPAGSNWGGLGLTAGCTAALLMAPFVAIAGGLMIAQRLPIKRGLIATALVMFIVFVVNQVRIGIVAVAMREWGTHTGYERSHVVLGSLLSTIGVAIGIVIFVVAMTRTREAKRG